MRLAISFILFIIDKYFSKLLGEQFPAHLFSDTEQTAMRDAQPAMPVSIPGFQQQLPAVKLFSTGLAYKLKKISVNFDSAAMEGPLYETRST